MTMTTTPRQNGKTTRQIVEAPQNALYVCIHGPAVHYTGRLARHLGRFDLKLVSIDQVNEACVSGRRAIIIDHACYDLSRLYGRQIALINHMNERAAKCS